MLAVLQGAGRVFWPSAGVMERYRVLRQGNPHGSEPELVVQPDDPDVLVAVCPLGRDLDLSEASPWRRASCPDRLAGSRGRTVAGSGLAYLADCMSRLQQDCHQLDRGLRGAHLLRSAPTGVGVGALALMLFALRRTLRAASPPVAMAAATPGCGP